MNIIFFVFTIIKAGSYDKISMTNKTLKEDQINYEEFNKNVNLFYLLQYQNDGYKVKKTLESLQRNVSNSNNSYAIFSLNEAEKFLQVSNYVLKMYIFVLRNTFQLLKFEIQNHPEKEAFLIKISYFVKMMPLN